jgi:hypothetical protein
MSNILIIVLAFAFSWMDIEYHEDQGLKPFFQQKSSISEEFASANEAYFSGDLATAKQKYSLISMRAYDENWDFYQRKMIVYSLLRLCQIERDRCDEYIQEIIFLDPDQIKQIDDSIFEPPLIHRSILLRNQLQRDAYQWQPTQEYEGVKYFIINGRIYNNTEGLTISMPLAKQRIVLIYPSYKQEIFVGEFSQFLKWKPRPQIASKIEKLTDPKLDINFSKNIEPDLDNTWWKENKKKVMWWSLAGTVVAYVMLKNNKSSNDGGPVTSTSKE